MALTAYENQTTRLLQNPAAPTTLYAKADLDTWINAGRQQLAAEGACIQAIGSINTAVSQRTYNFSAVDNFVTGTSGALRIERISINVATGQRWLIPRSYPYFELYFLGNPVVINGPPVRWAQLGQGSSGTFVLDPPPDQIYTLQCRCVCLPINLVDDTTAEVIPYPWTDAIAYYAAYLALLSAQSPARIADADRMFNHYTEYVTRARQFANPDITRYQYIQATDPTIANKLGLQKAAAGGG